MAELPVHGPYTFVDQDTDSVFQAREEIAGVIHRTNGVISYLAELFGWSGTKETAIATLFSNQAVLFAAGTRLWFHQSYPPAGWVQLPFDTGRYLMAVPDAAGDQWFGNFNHVLPSSEAFLLQQHLPAVTFYGSADFQGHHAHTYLHTIVDYTGGVVAFERDANGPKAWARYESRATDGGGSHAHNISVASGGSGWGHNHQTNMAAYRPLTTTGIIAVKS